MYLKIYNIKNKVEIITNYSLIGTNIKTGMLRFLHRMKWVKPDVPS